MGKQRRKLLRATEQKPTSRAPGLRLRLGTVTRFWVAVRLCERPVTIQSSAVYSPVARLSPELPELAQRDLAGPEYRLKSSADPPGSSSPVQVVRTRVPSVPSKQTERNDAHPSPQEAGAGDPGVFRDKSTDFEARMSFLSLWAGKNVSRTKSDLENAANLISWVLPKSALKSFAKDGGRISLRGWVWSLGAIRGPPVRGHTRPAEHIWRNKALQAGLEGIGAEDDP